MLNGSISFPKWVVLIQPCAWSGSSSNSLKCLERHETAVRGECYNFFPLKMNSESGTLPKNKGCNLMLCFCVIDLGSEYENEQELELFCGTGLVEHCALLSHGQTRVSSGQKTVLNHGQFCSGVALVEMP